MRKRLSVLTLIWRDLVSSTLIGALLTSSLLFTVPIASAFVDVEDLSAGILDSMESGTVEEDYDLYDAADGEVEEVSGDEDSDPFEDPLTSSAIRNAYLLIKLQQYLTHAETGYESLQEKIDDTRTQIEDNRYAIDTLEGQIAHLETLAEETAHKIHNVQEQIAEKELEIELAMEHIAFNEIELEEQKDALQAYFRLMYFEKNLYYSQDNELNALKILLSNDTTSNTLQKSTYLSLLEGEGEQILKRLQEIEHEIKRDTYHLNVKRDQLASLEDELEGEYRNLTAQLAGKQNLLDQTQGSDLIYRELFASYLLAQEAILEEINLFQANIEALDERIELLSEHLTEDDLEQIQNIRTESDIGYSVKEAAQFISLDWPVSPEGGLTAYFDDNSYASTFGVPHHALDIRIAHGSLIYAPADGVVYLVHDTAASTDLDESLGYGYLIIAHRKGVMTLYGHISSALVREGQYVHRGQIIGMTGGTPGTPGAGGRTTGAHLHFEVIQDGVRVDPLEYLTLADVPLDSLPDEYLPILEQELVDALEAENIHTEDIESLEETLSESDTPELTPEELEALEQAEIDAAVEEVTHETIETNPFLEEMDDGEEDYWDEL